MIIYLLRHGETDLCHSKRKDIDKNISLNDKGIQQVTNACNRINSNINKIYCSPTIRTIETANIVKTRFNLSSDLIIDDRLLNKQINDNIYEEQLRLLLNDLKKLEILEKDIESIILVTHGRIVKMLYSIVKLDKIDNDFLDTMDLEYGHLDILKI
jgi:phosphohistidine phosphatase SixA